MKFKHPRWMAPGFLLAWMLTSSTPLIVRAQEPKKAPEVVTSPDEQAIRDAAMEFVKRYESHDADALVALFAEDARYLFADGSEVSGREEIKQAFIVAFEANPKAAISVVVESIKLLAPTVAIEEGTTNFFPDGETPTSSGSYTIVHVKKGGQWQMQSVRVVKEETISPYEHLRSLEWLVGDWIDEGRDEVVEASFRWDENKAFLLQEFRVIRAGAVVLKGNQRIGWDPQSKQIRSWIFDSSGGFGDVVWTQNGESWTCKASGVSSEGDSSSATRILVRDSNDRVFWSSTNRVVNGQPADDLTVTMVRKPPQPGDAE